MRKLTIASGVALASLSLFAAPRAEAHFELLSPKNWWTMVGTGEPQKMLPCGNEKTAGTSATGVVTKVQAGQSIPVQVMSTIGHKGWYRVSLKQGASSTQTKMSLPDPPLVNQCTPAFVVNPVWSQTQPVIADKLGIPAGSNATDVMQETGPATFNVTIPAGATCTDAAPCTLQVLMIMTDHSPPSCNYHHCADISIVTTSGTGGTGAPDGGTDAHHGTGMGGATAGSGGSGAAGSTGSGTGGQTGTGGTSSATGGQTGTGGMSPATGGQPGTGGGSTATGGTSSTGGAPAGGHTGSNPDNSSGGCSVVNSERASRRALGIVLALGLVVVGWRRRRRSR